MSSNPTHDLNATVFVVLAFASVGAAPSPAAAANDPITECTTFADGWMAAYNGRDAGVLAAMYEPKKGTYSNVFWTATGHDVLVQAFKQELSQGTTMTSIKCETSKAVGNFGVSTGTWAATAKGPDGKDMPIGGHWESSFVGHRGKYLLINHTSNMQLPPPK